MKYLPFLFVLAIYAVPGFAQSDTAQHTTLDTITVSAPPGPAVIRGSAAREWEINHIRIALDFNWKGKTAGVREWVKLHPYFYATDSLLLDAKAVRVDSVLLIGKAGGTAVPFTYGDDMLKLHFARHYAAADTLQLYLKYTAMPYALPTGGSGAISDDRGLYFINTAYSTPHKPAMIWTQGETEANSHWMVTIDKPNSRYTTQVELTVPDSFTTLSNGALIKQQKNKKGLRTDIWKMDMPIQAYAVMFAIGKYSIIKDHWRSKEVNYYVEPEYARYARQMFKHTPEMMEYFSKRTGVPYPWNKYSQVVVRDYVSGAMENTTATLLGEFMNEDDREMADKDFEDVVSHELFHQWFGDYATCESWSNITVNESFANYGEQLWRRYRYGNASADELAYTNLQGYISYAQYNDPQLVRYKYDSREEVFDPISYNKGGSVLRYLNSLIGDAAFDKAMNLYLTKNALHATEAHNWRMAVEEATGLDWNWFFNEWYYHAGHPVLKVTYNYNDTTQKLTVTVKQTQSDSGYVYRLPLKTAVVYGGNAPTVVDWDIDKQTKTYTYPYMAGHRPLVIPDYNHALPGEMKDGKPMEQWREQFSKSEDYAGKRRALAAAGRLMSDSLSQNIIDMGLADSLYTIRRYAVSLLSDAQSDKYRKKWTARLITIAGTDKNSDVRSEAFSALGNWKAAGAQAAMLQALTDSSYFVAGMALEALAKINEDTAYLLARKMVNGNNKSALENAIWKSIGQKAADADISLFEAHADYIVGAKKMNFGAALGNYLKKVKSNASFSSAANLYTVLIINENLKGYRSFMGTNFFQVAGDVKDDTKSDDKALAAVAAQHLDIIKRALKKVTDAETDPDMKKEFTKSLASLESKE